MSDLYSIRVPPEGPKDARIMVLGETPGRKELKAKRPFIGTAGHTLDDLIAAVALDRSDIYISNIVKTYPTNPKDQFFFDRKGSPTKTYMDGILEILSEIKEIQPNVVVPVGKFALWALTQKTSITKWRGSILESTLVPGQKVIPTIHPAYYHHSHQWHEFILSEWDWQRIAKEAKTPDICLPEAEFLINPRPDQIEEAIARYTSCDLLTIDSEWYNPDTLAYIGFADCKDFATVISPDSMQAYRAFKEICSSDVPKIMQNAVFDIVALDRIGIKVKNVQHDTMIGFHSCCGDLRKKGLDTIGSVLTRWPYYSDDIEFVGQGGDEGKIYCGTDCVVEHESMEKLLDYEMNPEVSGGRRGYDISIMNLDIFVKASTEGIRCDIPKLKSLASSYKEKANELEQSVSERIGWTINCRSHIQVKQAVFDDMGLGKRYKKRTSAQDYLMDIAASETDQETKSILTDIIRVRQNRNIVSRYLNESIVDRDGRIRTNWNLVGTRNGRYSTTNPWWNGVALQTMPYDGREVCIADDGHVFVGWDLEQAEARHVAVFTHDYDLLDLMEEDSVDIHLKLVSDMGIFGVETYEEAFDKCAEVIAEGKSKDEYAPRYLCKQCRHAMNYNLSWKGLKKRINKDYLETGVGVNAALAKLLHSRYLELSPGLEAWWEEVYKTLIEQEYLINDFGRRRNFLGRLMKHSHIHRDAIAFRPQSNVADTTTISINRAAKRMPWGQCFAHMHDGGFFQVPEERKDDAVQIIREEMTMDIPIGSQTLTVPVEIKVGYDWKNMKAA